MNAKRCGHCSMRWSRCLCKTKSTSKNKVPNLVEDKAQTTLEIGEHVGSRISYWRRWMKTEGVRLGLWVSTEQHLSSQDHCQAPLSASSQPLEDDGDREGGRRGGGLPESS